MRILIAFAGISLAAFGASLATPQQRAANACNFKVSETTTQPTITGPDDVVAIAHVVEQPDSPVEILSADFTGSFVSISSESVSYELHCSIKVRNRSDQMIRGLSIANELRPANLRIFAGSGFVAIPDTRNGWSLAPGDEVEVKNCGTHRHAEAPNNRVVLLVAVDGVEMKDCTYMPSRRYPDFFDK